MRTMYAKFYRNRPKIVAVIVLADGRTDGKCNHNSAGSLRERAKNVFNAGILHVILFLQSLAFHTQIPNARSVQADRFDN